MLKKNLSPFFILVIGSVIILSWIFVVTPELKNNISNFEIYSERIGLDRIVTVIGEDLPEPIKTRDVLKQEVISKDGNNLEIHSTITTSNLLTEEIIFESKSVFVVDKKTRTHIEDPEKFFMFPNNVEKKNYEFIHPLIYFPTEFVFEKEDKLDNLDAYVFSCNLLEDDISDAYTQFSKKILSDSTCRVWVEPTTGTELWFEKTWHDYHLEQNQLFSVDKGFSKTSDFTKTIVINSVEDKKNLFLFYDFFIPIFMVVISVSCFGGIQIRKQFQEKKSTGLLELKEAKAKKIEEVLYDTIITPVATFDQNNKLVDCNQIFLNKIGFSKDELIEMHAPDFLTEIDQVKYRDIIQPSLVKGKRLMDVDLHLRKKDGSLFHSLWNHIRLSGDDNEYLGFIAIGLDLTENDELRNKLIKNERFVAIGELSSRIAHDIKNPLTALQNSVKIIEIKTGGDNELINKEIQRMNKAIKRIVHQVDQVLNFVKITPFNVKKNQLLEILNSSLESITITKNITVTIPKNDYTIVCDEMKIGVVFYNLFLNAVQAIGSDNGTITIRMSEELDNIKLEFENSGVGIDKENLGKIFEPLFTTKMEGTGLGLSSCKTIIQEHRGTISVSSNPVIFTILLPKTQ